MCSGSRRPEPGARERPSPGRRPRQHPRQEPRSRGRRCPEPGVNGCAAAGRVNEARRRGRGGGGGGGGGAAGIGMRPGAPLLVHSGPGRRLCHSRGRRRRLLRGSRAARRPVPQGAGKGAGRAEREEHRASSHQGGPFKLQIYLSSLYNSLLLHCHYREVHHMSGHRTESAGGHLFLP
ncbi:uncharacterized protein [Chlorocebus sabaeus]|uniref:uncharacterized protein isoform X2 n=1 Tax=Chlorocebus sabaeus TaxID=60711 RepID=UPI003BF9DE19